MATEEAVMDEIAELRALRAECMALKLVDEASALDVRMQELVRERVKAVLEGEPQSYSPLASRPPMVVYEEKTEPACEHKWEYTAPSYGDRRRCPRCKRREVLTWTEEK